MTTTLDLDIPANVGINPESVTPRLEERAEIGRAKRFRVVTRDDYDCFRSKSFRTYEKAYNYWFKHFLLAERKRALDAWKVVKY